MNLPRTLEFSANGRLHQMPLQALKTLREKHYDVSPFILDNEIKHINDIQGDTLEIMLRFVPQTPDAAFGLQVRRSDDGKRGLSIRYENN